MSHPFFIITTKQAKEGKIKVDVSASHTLQQAVKLPKVLTSVQLNDIWKRLTDESTVMGLPAFTDPEIYPEGALTRTDWIDEIFRTGVAKNYGISMSGGSEVLKGFVSFSYGRTDGLLLNTRLHFTEGLVSASRGKQSQYPILRQWRKSADFYPV
ncbi:hypothetical protein FACS1894199_19180 [Bacteroidia bacterium]|nr:hypothetical protein FACS1894199_19180 [Bacteroidia bacterium]